MKVVLDIQDGKAAASLTALQKFLLKGPVMTDLDYEEFLEKRKHLNAWKDYVLGNDE